MIAVTATRDVTATADRRLLTAPEAAAVLGLSTSYVRALLRRRELPSCRIGRSVRVPASELDRWIAARVIDTAGAEAGR